MLISEPTKYGAGVKSYGDYKDLNSLHLQKTAGERCAPGFVCYNGSEEFTLKGIRVLNPIKNGKFETIIPS